MKTGNTRSPRRQSAAMPGRSGRLSKLIVAAILTALVLAVFVMSGLHAPPPAEAQANNAATGRPGILYQDRPTEDIRTMRPGTTLIADTTGIADADGLTNPSWMYQWAHRDSSDDVTDIAGETSSTYLIEDDDIDKSFVLKVTFTDDEGNSEGPIESTATRFVGPTGLVVWNTPSDPTGNFPISLSATTTKFAQEFVAGAAADSYTLDFIELTFGTISDTAAAADGITVTLNADSSGSPGAALCTLEDPAAFSSSGAHKFHAPSPAETLSGVCPLLEASTRYHIVVERTNSYTGTLTVIFHPMPVVLN